MRHTRLSIVSVLAALVLLSSCSDSQSSAAGASKEFLTALAETDFGAACMVASDDGEPYEEGTEEFDECTQTLAYYYSSVDVETTKQAADGDLRATVEDTEAEVDMPSGVPDLELELIDGRWYVSDLS